ncbi:hypothetical protein Btru_078061 [Bulinus truncatus]|nr:hypothetical protein Btru_078061 [Bulinus truncatus]
MSGYLYHHLNGGGGFGGRTPNPTVSPTLEELMCGGGKTDGNLSASSNVSPHSMYSSILIRDLDLSEDSDADSESDDNTSASQSKKGKVISTSAEIPVKSGYCEMYSWDLKCAEEYQCPVLNAHYGDNFSTGAQSVESSSSSSSSSSGSDSDSDSSLDDDDGEDGGHQVGKEKTLVQRMSERRSSSSSSSSSDSSSGSDSEDGDDDEEEDKTEAVEEMKIAAEKTPSPVYNKPASVGTPHSVDNHDHKSWSLINFINPIRKSSTSPVAASPSKPFSPPTVHSAPPSVQLKEDSGGKPSDENHHQRTLKEIGPCVSMPFDVLAASKHSDEEADIDEASEVLNVKTSHQPAVRKSSSSSFTESKKRIDQGGDNRRQWSKDKASLESPSIRKHEYGSTPKSSGPEVKQGTPSFSSLEKSSNNKRLLSRAGSSSDDEFVDVVGLTPEKPQQPPNKVYKGKQEVPISNGTSLSASDEDNHDSMAADKNAPSNQPKHHRRKDFGRNDTTTPTNISTEASSSGDTPAVVKTSKMLPSDLESISRPPNLLSPIHSAYSPSPTPSSSKPLPSFRTSFSPSSSHTGTAKTPTVTVSRDGDGSPAPKVMIQIRLAFLPEKQLSRLRDKKEKLKNGVKLSKDVKTVETSIKGDTIPDSQKDSRVPPVPDIKSNSSYSSSIKETIVPGSSQDGITPAQTQAKASKRKPLGSDTSDGPADHNHKIKKSHKEMSLAPTSTSSISSVSSNISTANVPGSKSSKMSNPNTDSVLVANKPGHSNAVKNLDFESNTEVVPVNDSSAEALKNSKRKLDNVEDSISKKVKAEPLSEKSPSVTLAQPASISRSRRDSAASNSSKGSHQSLKKSSRRSSSNSNKNSNNNNIEKASTHISNGPDLPFHQYVNGTSRAGPSNLPSPLPIETQLQSTEHYLARAKEHKHLADSQKDKLAKFEPYLRSCLNFCLAGYTLEQSKKDLNASYTLYNDTSNLLQKKLFLKEGIYFRRKKTAFAKNLFLEEEAVSEGRNLFQEEENCFCKESISEGRNLFQEEENCFCKESISEGRNLFQEEENCFCKESISEGRNLFQEEENCFCKESISEGRKLFLKELIYSGGRRRYNFFS